MFLQIQQLPKDPMQSSQSFVIPIRFEVHQPAKAKQTTHLTIKSSETIKRADAKTRQCRICLQSDQQQSKLVNPCKCTGSIEYAHIHCLIQWIKRRISMNSEIKAKCELCDTDFNYKIARERVFDCGQLKKNYNKQKRGLICFGLVYGFLLLLFIAIIVLVTIGKDIQALFMHAILSSGGGKTIVVSFLIIYSIGLAVVMVLFISQYMVKQELTIIDVKRYKDSKALAKNYKIYYRR